MGSESFHQIIRGQRRGPVAATARAGLRLLSWPYGLAVRLRNRLFDRGWKHTFRAAVPVISVGNLTLGGTGKTPCVEYVAGLLRERGVRPVILSRGYGAEHNRNDEAMVLEENLPDVPHLQGADRVQLAMTAVEELDADVLILDDGFQHRRLTRDLDIVLIDATALLAGEAMFPRGVLREPIAGLSRADVLVLTRCDQTSTADEQAAWLKQRFPTKPVAKAVHRPMELVGPDGVTESLEVLKATPVAGFCGIGNPEAFRGLLTQLGAPPVAFRTFADHHAYTREDVADLTRWATDLPPNAVIVTTQKDWVKLRVADLGGRKLWALRIGFQLIEGEEAFAEMLNRFTTEGTENTEEGTEERSETQP
ncbi:tetraacyldisaccharide 4'-kinase [Limnoglobus roseus]|uniref:Tetraacyldisaccharide 4'-kinase n=1 Tax=Limnoglobus roseus TaxID=2598579 RepID=A0A5C1ABZ8_9BACT|nr:tetraacyldisaccharide 4'-kinase [Limnoglobus roseus]QEL14548.1 tetraacyldisaccharide 4'-kinase [Limnoglobus roseus]